MRDPLLGEARRTSSSFGLGLGSDSESESESQTGEPCLRPSPPTSGVDAASASSPTPSGASELLQLAGTQQGLLCLGCAVLLVRLPCSLSRSHLVSTVLADCASGDFAGARRGVMWLLGIGTVDAGLDFWCVYLFGLAQLRMVRELRTRLFRSLLGQDVAFFDGRSPGELASRLGSDCAAMAGELTWVLRFSIESFVRIWSIVVYMLWRCPKLGALACTMIPAVALANKVYGDWLQRSADEVQGALAKANAAGTEVLSAIRTVLAFCGEPAAKARYEAHLGTHYKVSTTQVVAQGVYYMGVSTFLVSTVVPVILLWYGAVLVARGEVGTGTLVAFMLYHGQLQEYTLQLFQSFTALMRSGGTGREVFALLRRSPGTPCSGYDGGEMGRAPPGGHAWRSVEFVDVHFAYPGKRSGAPILRGLSFTVSRGQTLALTGPSGCGKSTVAALLQRFYDPQRGRIVLDGLVEYTSLSPFLLRSHVGVVAQESVLFSGTVHDNIAYGLDGGTSPSVSRQAVRDAAKVAHADEFISGLPQGYDTDVGERGGLLSGGQRQRIAIARAVLRQPALLILDEATSSLDHAAETAVQVALDALLESRRGECMTVVIAHRPKTLAGADVIGFLGESGTLEEFGTHDELLAIPGGRYRAVAQDRGPSAPRPLDAGGGGGPV